MFPRRSNLSKFVGRKSHGTSNLPISNCTLKGRCIRNRDWDWVGIAFFFIFQNSPHLMFVMTLILCGNFA